MVGVGGRVLDFQEQKPIEVGAVTPKSLIAFSEDRNPDLKFSPDPKERAHFREPFKALRTLPLEEREDLLVDFLTQGVKNFPNGEELGKYLALINGFAWLIPQEKGEVAINTFEDATAEFYRRLNLEPLPVELFEKEIVFGSGEARLSPDQPWEKAQDAIRDAARVNGLEAAREVAWNMAWGIPTAPSFYIVNTPRRIVAISASWIVVSDLMPKKGYEHGNPCEPLMTILGLGYWPIGEITNKQGENRFAILDLRSQ